MIAAAELNCPKLFLLEVMPFQPLLVKSNSSTTLPYRGRAKMNITLSAVPMSMLHAVSFKISRRSKRVTA